MEGDQNLVETDVLIVGTGPIGAIYARKLLDASMGIKVTMVDIGQQGTRLIGNHKKNNITVQKDLGRFTSTIQGAWSRLSVPPEPPMSSLRITADQNQCSEPNSIPIFTRGNQNPSQSPDDNLPAAVAVREVGGMSSYWTSCTPEQHPTIERSTIFSTQEWERLYTEARVLFHTTSHAFDDSLRQSLLLRTLRQTHKNRLFTGMPLACRRSQRNLEYVEWTATAHILGDVADPKSSNGDFDLLAQHCCKRLNIDWQTGQVTGAELHDLLANKVFHVKAKKFVICAGSVLGAGILYASGICSETGYPALGHYMTEQTVSLCQIALKKELIESVWNDPRCEEQLRNHPNDPLGIPLNDPDPQITSPLSREFPWHTQIHRDAYGYGAIPPEIDQRQVLDLRFFSYVKPTYDNCVQFSDHITDYFGMPQPTFHFRIGKDDSARASAMMEDMVNMASALGSYIPGGEPRMLPLGAALHICGTTRAGEQDDGQSVVEKHSKVWRLENLFVGGCGVIPTQNACNPTLTAACFAIAGAGKLVEEFAPPITE